MRRAVLLAGLAIALVLPYLGILPAWTPALGTVAMFTAVSLIGLNLIFGATGMLSLGQSAFVALPAYVAGILHIHGVPNLAAIALGAAATIATARLVAQIFVRLPRMYFAIGTLGFAFMLEGLVRAFPSVTGGATGLVLESPIALGRDGWYLLSATSLAIALASYAGLVRHGFLRRLKLVGHDELAAEVLGVDVPRLKARIFTIGSAYSTAGGLLLSYYVGVLTPEGAGVNASLEALAKTMIGGAGATFGPVWGAVVLQWLFAVSGSADRYGPFVYGAAFFLVVLFAPRGIDGIVSSFVKAATGRSRRSESPRDVKASDIPDRGPSSPVRESELACLRVADITVNFGGLCAVDRVSFEIRPGEIVAIVGPNGAGKSTLFNVISGIERPSTGRLWLDSDELGDLPIHRRATVIGRSFQVPRLVPSMTVLDNVIVRLDQLSQDPEPDRRRAASGQLAAFDLEPMADRFVAEITVGHHKAIELARACLGRPRLLLLDEPAVGLTQDEVAQLSRTLVSLKGRGVAILVVEHNLDFVASIADQVLVMDGGRVIARGLPDSVMSDPDVRAAYFGALK